jgi:hypothetical protein
MQENHYHQWDIVDSQSNIRDSVGQESRSEWEKLTGDQGVGLAATIIALRCRFIVPNSALQLQPCLSAGFRPGARTSPKVAKKAKLTSFNVHFEQIHGRVETLTQANAVDR